MSGDVQPRKRKDKKRKKDELGVEEPRGTAAVLGEGDVYMHSHHDHGTGGHWCAKIIFFSLLAVLITLIGLIILENRGLSELEANSVESRYSGVLEGWLEEVPDDDHHDEHTLELNHQGHDITHDEDTHNLEDEDQDDEEIEHSDEDTNDEDNEDQFEDNEDENESEDDEEQLNDDAEDDEDQLNDDDEDDEDQLNNDDEDEDQLNDDDEDDQLEQDDDDAVESKNAQYDEDDGENEDDEESQEQDMQNDEEEEDNHYYGQQADSEEDEHNNDDNDDNSNEIDKNDGDDSNEFNDLNKNSDDNDDENDKEDEDEHEDEEDNDDEEIELEKLEKEASEEEPISIELAALPEEDDDDDNDKDVSTEVIQNNDGVSDPEEEEYLEADDDIEESSVEHISAPPGKPLVEMEDDLSSEQPPDTLAEEEEYEKRQEELRREEEQSSHMWLKLTVGGALLVATHTVMRRATRDSTEEDEPTDEIETSVTDRRMTLISDEPPATVPARNIVEEIPQPRVEKKVESVIPIIKPTIKREEIEKEDEPQSDEEDIQEINPTEDKELCSDEDEEELIEPPKIAPKQSHSSIEKDIEQELEPEELEEDPDDVEIIDEEELEEEDEEEISDVDDGELLSRLEAKYGKLPEPERPGFKPKDGGNSINDWPGEPSDAYWRRQLDSAERELNQGEWEAAGSRVGVDELRDSGRARWIAARALDLTAEARRDNRLLSRAIAAYLHLLKINERLSDKKLLQVTQRTLDRMQFRGTYLNAEPVYRLLIRRFPNEPAYRNNLTISFLMANRADLAEDTLKETLKLWPDDRVALAHYGFVLKTRHNRNEEAVEAFKKALEGDTGPACEPRFYYHYGDSLLLLNRIDEAHEVHKRGAAMGHFLSPVQRSLYNVPRLKSSPWWRIEDTPYSKLAKALERSWKEILKEAEAAKALYEQESEGLRERGEWSQLDLFARGQEVPNRCKRAPVTCSVVKSEIAAVGCRRGQIKFSAMAPGTHVRPHVGPTNCRLRMHLGLSNTKDTYIRVGKEIRQWQVGKTFLFDDSFEHEVWHNGSATRLVLIVDVWHPHLTAAERRTLPAI